MCTALSFRVMCMLRTLMQCLPEWSPVPLCSGDNLLEYLWVYEINRGPPATWMNLLCPNFLSSKGQLNGDLMEHIFGAGPRSINSFLSRNQWAKTEFFRFGFYGHGLVFFRCLSMTVYRQTRLSKSLLAETQKSIACFVPIYWGFHGSVNGMTAIN